tara:strand:- start:320 stop:610 length:291 start_codon:yes stop_codon:yes gene_type:complete
MSKFERKIRRQQAKEKKKLAEKEMATKVAMFGNLGEACLICDKEFDKTDKEMVSSWYVVVREQENKVNLYCPPCWESALQNIKEIQEAIAEDKNDN